LNSDKSARPKQRGNALIYVLIGLGLLALLTAMITRQNNDNDDASDDQMKLNTTKLIGYALSAQGIVNQMLQSGSTVSSIDFVNPTSTGFDTAPYGQKFYHPEGGGFNYQAAQIPPFVASGIPTAEGWYITKRNVEWTPTTATDIVMAAYSIDPAICKEINKRITGTAAPLLLTTNSTRIYLTDYNTSAFSSASCPTCVGYPSACVANADGTYPTFYSILEAQ